MINKLIEAMVASADETRINQAENAYENAKKDRIVDVSEIEYLPIYNKKSGKLEAVINPKDIALKTQYLINAMNDAPLSSFMSPYLQKKIIWSLGATTAFTNGVRIGFSPIFAFFMFKKGSIYTKEIVSSLAVECAKNNSDFYLEKNMATGLYIRFVITHEVYHMIYQHVRRSILYIEDPTNEECQYISNVAQDLEINRDIVGRWPEYEKVIKDGGFLWYRDPEFKNVETDQYFEHESWEDIYDYLMRHKDQVPETENNPKASDPKQVNSKYPGGFKDGWNAAFDKLKDGSIDPLTINF